MSKVCSRCKQEKPLTEYCKLSKSRDGRRYEYIACAKEDFKIKKELAENDTTSTKQCKQCNQGCKHVKVVQKS